MLTVNWFIGIERTRLGITSGDHRSSSSLKMEMLTYQGGSRLAWVVHVMAVASAVMVIVWCIYFRHGFAFSSPNKDLIFNLHPLLMLVGFILKTGEALVLYRTLPPTLSPKKKIVIKVVSMIMHTTALLFGILGIFAAFKYHVDSGTANLYSLHSWLGMTIILLYIIQWMHGFWVFLNPGAGGSYKLRSGSSVLGCHVKFTMSIFVLAIGNAVIGFVQKLTTLENSGLPKFSSEALLINFTAIASMLFGILVVLTMIPQPPQTDQDFFRGYEPLISQC
ncbi:hypothetical protein Dimus_028254 [Dionaea muscipula]